MKYMGSKRRIAKHILPIMLAERQKDQYWVEPFVGGANIIDKVSGNRIGNDINKYLISLLKAVQSGWTPPTEISEEFYKEVKENKDKYPEEVVGFVGFLCSFGGRWFEGYARDKTGCNYADRGNRSLLKQASNIKDVIFECGSYEEMVIPNNSIIYCDPPYANTKSYLKKFDHEKFFEWCRAKRNEGHTVFLSEYSAPEDFECILSIESTTFLNKNKRLKKVEKLFKLVI